VDGERQVGVRRVWASCARANVAKVTKVIDQAIKATRIARRLNRRARRRFENGGKQVFGRNTHHQTPDHIDIS
jgi:hypothetical protein